MTTLDEGLKETRKHGTSDRNRYRKTIVKLFRAAMGTLAFVLVTYWLTIAPRNSDYVEPDDVVVRYPAPPPSEAGPPARSDICPGTPPDPDNPRRLAPGETQVVNKDKRCGYTFSVIAGNVELDAPAPKIPEKATCMGPEPCELYDMLCPYGKAPTDGGWECKGSGGSTTNEYGVAAGVDLRLGVFHTTD